VGRGYTVGDRGVRAPAGLHEVVDVFFGADRVWSFDPGRERWPLNRGWVEWPSVLDGHLDGVVDVRLVLHGTDRVVFERRVRMGDGRDPIQLVDDAGHLMAVDGSGHLVRTFAHTDPAQTAGVLDSVDKVLRDLRDHCGLDAFLTFGCLLGAVRDGHLIGHDCDADVSYLSRHTHPFDIIRENKRVCSAMRSLGWSILRMSAGDFKIWVRPGGGPRVGIDVFASFHVAGSFYLMPYVTGDLPRTSLLPVGEVTLEGRQLAAPAEPEAMLEAAYGPAWRVPDPAFDHEASRATYRRLNGWMRSNQKYIKHWNDFYRSRKRERVPTTSSSFARWVADQLPHRRHILDVGCGNGRDSVFFAERGHRLTALDASPHALRLTRRLATEHAVAVRTAHLNLSDLRSTLLSGARFARLKRPPDIYARFLLDAIAPDSRRNFFRWAQMIQRRGGVTYLEFRTWHGVLRASASRFHYRALLDPDSVIAEIESHGGIVVHDERGTRRARYDGENPRVCRVTVRWA
jgi:SAM-dependent methyltransferase